MSDKKEKKSFAKGDIIYTDDEGKQYGISKRELGVMGAGGDKQASKALKRMKNHTFIYPDKILREKKAKGGRVGLKAGSTGCKLAMKGKGRAYGKNS